MKSVREVIRGKPRMYSILAAGRRVYFKKGEMGNCYMLLRGQIP